MVAKWGTKYTKVVLTTETGQCVVDVDSELHTDKGLTVHSCVAEGLEQLELHFPKLTREKKIPTSAGEDSQTIDKVSGFEASRLKSFASAWKDLTSDKTF